MAVLLVNVAEKIVKTLTIAINSLIHLSTQLSNLPFIHLVFLLFVLILFLVLNAAFQTLHHLQTRFPLPPPLLLIPLPPQILPLRFHLIPDCSLTISNPIFTPLVCFMRSFIINLLP